MFADTRDISNLLGRAGFTLLTVDVDELKITYPSMWELIEDLRDMGESNAIIGR
jgi:NADH dehydrogenase [ubiquinone] 1 alpha subcomplex assembly factor 5